MDKQLYIDAVPAYYASENGLTVPLIVSLLFYDTEGKPRITTAVEKSINRTIEITGREGLATATITDNLDLENNVVTYIERAMKLEGAIILFRCQSPETAEKLIQFLNHRYTLSLVRDQHIIRS